MADLTAAAPRSSAPSLQRLAAGLAAGIAVGLFFGERARVFQVAADGFVRLMQMAVLPYVTVAVIANIGGLRVEHLRALGGRMVVALVALWSVALAFAFLMPLAFPPRDSATFFSTTLLDPPPSWNLLDLYIPANPFFALANNIVPAVVVFSIVVGLALAGLPGKQPLIDVLATAAAALARVMRFVTRLTPYGIFAIAASTAGTLRVEDAGRLQIYLVAYCALAVLVALWVLPGLVSVLTPFSVRDIFAATHETLLTATIAGDLFIVLPLLIASVNDLIARRLPGRQDAATLPDVIVPIAYNFPHAGKLLSVSFILFAGWFSDASIAPVDYPQLALVGIVTMFGSITAAVPFLLDLFRVPADTFQLFVASTVINSRVGSLVAAMHTVALALLTTCAISGGLRWQARRGAVYLAATVTLTVAVIGGTRVLAEHLIDDRNAAADVLASMTIAERAPAMVALSLPPPRGLTAESRLAAITTSGTLRVGVLDDALPFAFMNARGELVGFDVALVHHLARELGVRLEFVELPRTAIDDAAGAPAVLRAGSCDILIGGIAVTTTRASAMQLSQPYMNETMAFVVRDGARHAFESWSAIREQRSLTLAVPHVQYFIEKVRERLPGATLVPVTTIAGLFESGAADAADAVVLPAERGSAWTLRYPHYTVVVPQPNPIEVPLAFALPRDEPALAAFVDTWIDLKRHDGTIGALYDRWILGRDPTPPAPRWSIMRDVLHWSQ